MSRQILLVLAFVACVALLGDEVEAMGPVGACCHSSKCHMSDEYICAKMPESKWMGIETNCGRTFPNGTEADFSIVCGV